MNTHFFKGLALAGLFIFLVPQNGEAEHDASKNILKQGLLGAGVGAISAEASGGKAGKGALVGAGTNILGGALLDGLFGGGKHAPAPEPVPRPRYRERQPASGYQDPYYDEDYYEPAPPPRRRTRRRRAPAPQDKNRDILKQGLLGAGVGAISAEASGGKAGKGALIGAGTNVLGGALLDFLSGDSQNHNTYYEEPYEEQYYYEEEEYYGEDGYKQGEEPVRRRRRIIQQY